MPPRHATVQRAQAPRHATKQRTHRVRHVAALTVLAVLAFSGAGVATAYTRLQGNVEVADVADLVGPAPTPSATPDPDDPLAGQDVTILVMGSDERDGENGVIGGTDGVVGMRSDTTIVVHISADRTRAELVSIPRDSLVAMPSCTMTDGSTSSARSSAMFNEAFATGWDQGGDLTSAAACTIKTVQSLTGLAVDHFVVVDFAGFQRMVDAIGGVPMCVPEDYSSPDAGLYVTAGFQTLDGPTALAYARARKGTNMNGSDLERADRQQELVAAMITQVMSKNLFTDVGELLSFLDAATASLTVDPGLSGLTDMAGLALSLQTLRTENIAFMTVPVATAPSDPNRVVWTSAADELWARMAADLPVTAQVAAPAATATAGATPSNDPGATAESPATTPPPTVTEIPGLDVSSASEPGVCG